MIYIQEFNTTNFIKKSEKLKKNIQPVRGTKKNKNPTSAPLLVTFKEEEPPRYLDSRHIWRASKN